MNMSKYPTLIRDIPTEKPMEPRTAAQDMAAGETFYGDEWVSPEKLRAIRKAQEDAAPEMFAALIAIEDAETFNANCEECEGHGIPELCPACFLLFDDARLKRRAALAKAIAERETQEDTATISALRAINADLLAFAKNVASHFAHTRLPLGVAARAVIAKATAEREIDRSSRVTGAAGGGSP
jgi:hypothetical protein